MSTSQGKKFQEIPLDPKNLIEYDSNFTEKDGKALMDVLRHDPEFFHAFAHAVDGMARMNMRPPTQERKTMKHDLPVIEKSMDGDVLTLKVTAPPSGRGFCKEDVHVFVENGGLMIDIHQKPAFDSESSSSSSGGVQKGGVEILVNSPWGRCIVDEIKAEISNGVLTVVCPKECENEADAAKDVGVHHIEVKYK